MSAATTEPKRSRSGSDSDATDASVGSKSTGSRSSHGNGSAAKSRHRNASEERPKQSATDARKQSREYAVDGSNGRGNSTEAGASAKAPAASGSALPITRMGGVYLPPHRMRRVRQNIRDKTTEEYQRIAWEELRKGINGVVNKVNTGNITNVLPELFEENLVRGRGLLCRALMKAEMASPQFAPIYAALVAVVNTKLPVIGELLLKRLIVQFRRAITRHDKIVAVGVAKFVAHLVNQQVAHEILALQILTLLLEKPTDDSVEVAVSFIKECGQMLTEVSPQGVHAVFERFRSILHEGMIDKRVQFMIEGLFVVRKNKFKEYPARVPELDLVETEDQITHDIGLDDELDREDLLNVYRYDPEFEKNEERWKEFQQEILGEESDSGSEAGDSEEASGSNAEEEGAGSGEREGGEAMQEQPSDPSKTSSGDVVVHDMTEQDVIALRRQIFLTIMNSMGFEEACHKLLKLRIPDGMEMELCNMVIECCAQEKTFRRFYGNIAQRFCLLSPAYQQAFDDCFREQYRTCHRLETRRLRNTAKFFGHLFSTDALPWESLGIFHLNEEETTSASRIFIKVLLQDLASSMGMAELRRRLLDPARKEHLQGMFPMDKLRNTRYAVNFFTLINLGPLTDELREHLKQAPQRLSQQQVASLRSKAAADVGSDSSSSSSSSSVSSSSSSGSSSTGSSRSSRSRSRSRSSSSSSSRSRSPSSASSKSRSRSRSTSPGSSRSRSRSASKSASRSPSEKPRPKRSREKRNRTSDPVPVPSNTKGAWGGEDEPVDAMRASPVRKTAKDTAESTRRRDPSQSPADEEDLFARERKTRHKKPVSPSRSPSPPPRRPSPSRSRSRDRRNHSHRPVRSSLSGRSRRRSRDKRSSSSSVDLRRSRGRRRERRSHR